MGIQKRQLIAPWLTLLLLAGLGAFTYSRQTPEDAMPYHRRVQAAVEALAVNELGTGRGGRCLPVPEGAAVLLHPNAITSRMYQNMVTGQVITFLVVHCRDARDMEGHYPPVCYAGQGWLLGAAKPMDFELDKMPIPAMEYQFSQMKGGVPIEQTVYNFMILPDGTFARDIEGVYQTAKNYKKRFYGGGTDPTDCSGQCGYVQHAAAGC